jgi:hypothetical protein
VRIALSNEDITMVLDTHTPRPSPSCTSSPTQLPRPVRNQPTPPHSFGDISIIRRRNEVYKDVLERGHRPVDLVLVLTPERLWIMLCDHKKVLCHLFCANSALYRVGPSAQVVGAPFGQPEDTLINSVAAAIRDLGFA